MSQANDELIAHAQDPNAPLETLHQLAQNYPDLRPYIAANPRTYPALLEWLGTLEDPAVDAALAARAGGLPGAGGGVADSTQVLSQQPSPASAPGSADGAAGPAPVVPPRSPVGASPASQTTQITQLSQTSRWPAGHTIARTVGAPTDGAPASTGGPGLGQAGPAAPTASMAPIASAASGVSAASAVSAAPPASAASAAPVTDSYTQAIPAQPGAVVPQPPQPQPFPQEPASPYHSPAPSAAPVAPSASQPTAGEPPQAASAPPVAAGQVQWPAIPPAQVATTYPGQAAQPRPPAAPPRRSTHIGTAAYAAGGAGASQPVASQPAPPTSNPAALGVGTEDTDSSAPSGRFLWFLAAVVGALVVFIASWYLTGNSRDSSADVQGASEVTTASEQESSAPPESSSPATTASATPTPSATPSLELSAPAPADAIEMSTFTSPSGNITCTLSSDSVSCTINDYDFVDPSCTDTSKPFTATVGTEGQATGSCGQSFSTTGASLQYGSSAKNDTFACTSASSGIECWSQVTGEGFTLSRESTRGTQR